jgi:hypothetical protein
LYQTKETLTCANEELRAIASEVGEHFIRSNQVALDQAETHNQTDLKRYKRKFQTLKNTYINQDVKQRFIHGLNVPDLRADQQQAILQQLDATLEQQSESLRELKQQNDTLQSQVTDTVKRICSTVEEYQSVSTTLANKIDAALEQHDEHDASKPPMPSPLPAGPMEEECNAQVQQEMSTTKELETKIASIEAQNADLETSAKLVSSDVQSLQLELQRLEAIASDMAKEADAHAQYKRSAGWCKNLSSLMATLGSLSLQHVGEDSLSLELVVSVPAGSSGDAHAGADRPAPKALPHELTFFFQPVTTAIIKGRLAPSSVPIDDIIEAAPAGPAGLRFVVLEVRARLRQHWRRQLLLDEVAAQFPVQVVAAGEPSVRVVLPSKAEVEVVVPWDWPTEGQQLQLVKLWPASSSAEAQQLCDAVAARPDLPLADLMQLVQAVVTAGV